jgi:hypothetical protein
MIGHYLKITALLGGMAIGLAAAPASAMIAPFGGVALGTDPLGHSWQAANVSGKGSWGEPGLLAGTLHFNPAAFTAPDGRADATEFDFIFLRGVSGTIDETPASSPFGSELTTRFSDITKGVLWIPTFTSAGKEVDFTAPEGSRIDPGDEFFVNVVFTGSVNTTAFSFAGLWTERAPIPEPTGLVAIAAGLFGLGLLRRRRRG